MSDSSLSGVTPAELALPDYAPRTLVTLTSRRFDKEPRIVEIIDRVAGTACYRVDLMDGSRPFATAFATASELDDFDPAVALAERRAAEEYWDERNPR